MSMDGIKTKKKHRLIKKNTKGGKNTIIVNIVL